jgi:hypothetical protein
MNFNFIFIFIKVCKGNFEKGGHVFYELAGSAPCDI